MNAIEYVTQEASSSGYCGKMTGSGDFWIPTKDNFRFIRGRKFTDDEYELLRDGDLLVEEIEKQARRLETALKREARKQFADWDIPINRYECEIEFDSVTCDIYFIHKKNGVTLCLKDVYFSNSGEILQCVHSFR